MCALNDVSLGVDVGSVSVSCALLDPAGEILATSCRCHRGGVREVLGEDIARIGAQRAAIALTGSAPEALGTARYFDPQVCLIAAGRRILPGLGAILHVGGERFGLIRFDEAGKYAGSRGNSSCAAGTGSFLDQQARRLGLAGSNEVALAAMASRGEPPRISSRCAVFARTDLVHAQQAGYALEDICEGLCQGLARNVADALLGGQPPRSPVLFAGGVAANEAVRRHLQRIIGAELATHALSPVLGAVGAALCLLEEHKGLRASAPRGRSPVADKLSSSELLSGTPQFASADSRGRQYFYQPLELPASCPPMALRRFLREKGRYCARHPVEVELYRELAGETPMRRAGRAAEFAAGEAPTGRGVIDAWLGIDIGSASTKAMVARTDGAPLVGLYARTLGAPITATQALLESLGELVRESRLTLRILGAATTGAGRKLIGTILGADLIVNEISAHARAALELDPEVDTIIEIGGQDAKFTLLTQGRVTFAHMNTVCAAGTGSFLEEQAARLGCDLDAYEQRAVGTPAPLVSDRCAVFMERDTNDLLAQGYSVEEILAASLFAVRENYLQKVSRGHRMGRRICFQGATGRNRALVAAFEQGLRAKIAVSPYCHLAGAWGAALLLREERAARAGSARSSRESSLAESSLAEGPFRESSFRGLAGVLRQEIPLRAETCELCANRCRLTIAEVAGETVAYGFLCGRDYDTRRFVSANRSGFDPAREWKRAHTATCAPEHSAARAPLHRAQPVVGLPTIGLPAALSMRAELSLWRTFFAELGIPVVASETFSGSIELGRRVQGAEFCAPLASFHGHVAHLATKADWLFLPVRLDERHEGARKLCCYCYYTQFAPSLAHALAPARGKCLMPLVSVTAHRARTARELAASLRQAGIQMSVRRVAAAFDRALEKEAAANEALRRRFREEVAGARQPAVVLLGRPYTLLSEELEKGISSIFASLGTKVFYPEMVPYRPEDVAEIRGLLNDFHWHYAGHLLEVALVAARAPMLYPVYVTSFKCSPDSFALEYFRRICDEHEKPYLVLELDDHDSAAGYQTRIEAGLASFRNHAVSASGDHHAPVHAVRALPRALARAAPLDLPPARSRVLPVVPKVKEKLDGRTLLLPNWDDFAIPLAAAGLRGIGIDARPLEESPLTIRAAMRQNTGQCIPVSILAEEAMQYVERHGLDPARTALWMVRAGWACNIGMFAPFLTSTFESRGFQGLSVYRGELLLTDLGLRATLAGYRAVLLGGMLRASGCRLRPYERIAGSTEAALHEAVRLVAAALERNEGLSKAARQAADLLASVETDPGQRPKAAIFGDLFVRDNDVMSQGLIAAIEEAGGEAIPTGYIDYWRIIMPSYLRKWNFAVRLRNATLWNILERGGRELAEPFERFLGAPRPVASNIDAWLAAEFGIRPEHEGESFDNLVKVVHLLELHPDLRLFVQASPAFCCPSLVTEAMARDIQRVTGVPVVTLTYDGTGRSINEAIVPYLSCTSEGPRCRARDPSSQGRDGQFGPWNGVP